MSGREETHELDHKKRPRTRACRLDSCSLRDVDKERSWNSRQLPDIETTEPPTEPTKQLRVRARALKPSLEERFHDVALDFRKKPRRQDSWSHQGNHENLSKGRALRLPLKGHLLQRGMKTTQHQRCNTVTIAGYPQHNLLQETVIRVSCSDFTSSLMKLDQKIGPRDR